MTDKLHTEELTNETLEDVNGGYGYRKAQTNITRKVKREAPLRRSAMSTSDIITMLPKGTKAESTSRLSKGDDDYYYFCTIHSLGQSGYVAKSFFE